MADERLPSESFIERYPYSGTTTDDKASRAETLSMDLIMVMSANVRLLASVLALIRRENPTFVAELEQDLEAMRGRLAGMITQITKVSGDV